MKEKRGNRKQRRSEAKAENRAERIKQSQETQAGLVQAITNCNKVLGSTMMQLEGTLKVLKDKGIVTDDEIKEAVREVADAHRNANKQSVESSEVQSEEESTADDNSGGDGSELPLDSSEDPSPSTDGAEDNGSNPAPSPS